MISLCDIYFGVQILPVRLLQAGPSIFLTCSHHSLNTYFLAQEGVPVSAFPALLWESAISSRCPSSFLQSASVLFAEVKVSQLCSALCGPLDCSLPGFSINGILQARILVWVAVPFSRDLPNPGMESRSPVLQADSLPSEPPGKPIEESRLPCPPPGDLPNPWLKPRSPALKADSLPTEPPGNPKTKGVGSLSLLQGIFPTQECRGLLHCRQILYHGSPTLCCRCQILGHCWVSEVL